MPSCLQVWPEKEVETMIGLFTNIGRGRETEFLRAELHRKQHELNTYLELLVRIWYSTETASANAAEGRGEDHGIFWAFLKSHLTDDQIPGALDQVVCLMHQVAGEGIEQGNARAQFEIGAMYEEDLVPPLIGGDHNLGDYNYSRLDPPDNIGLAHMWYGIAAANGNDRARDIRRDLEQRMSAPNVLLWSGRAEDRLAQIYLSTDVAESQARRLASVRIGRL